MMGNWSDVRSPTGRLVARIDAERRLLEIVRNGEQVLLDLDRFVPSLQALSEAERLVGHVGPSEIKTVDD